MITFEQSLSGLVQAGLITYDDAVARSLYPQGHRTRAPAANRGSREAARRRNATTRSSRSARPSARSRTTTASTRAAPASARCSSICKLSTLSRSSPCSPSPSTASTSCSASGWWSGRSSASTTSHGPSPTDSRSNWWTCGAITPDPAATALLDEATARRLVAIPAACCRRPRRRCGGRAVEWSIAALREGDRSAGRRRGRRPLGHPGRHRQQLPGADWRHSQIRAFEAEQAKRGEADSEHRTVSSVSEDAPVVQVVQLIITQALRDRASDIHIEPQTGPGPGALPDRRRTARRPRSARRHGSGRGRAASRSWRT